MGKEIRRIHVDRRNKLDRPAVDKRQGIERRSMETRWSWFERRKTQLEVEIERRSFEDRRVYLLS